jgi:hypothetical protein
MKYGLEFRHHEPPTMHPENEIVCWNGKTCYTVAVFRYNAHEPCWYLETVGNRIVGLDSNAFMREVKRGFDYLCAAEDIAETEGTE